MKRRFDPAQREIMDEAQPLSAALERDLRNLRQLNRFFGSYDLVQYFLDHWIPGPVAGANSEKSRKALRVIDLATGSGDIPRLVATHARKIGAEVSIDAIDAQPSTLDVARALSAEFPEIKFHEGDIRTWKSSEPYDIVLCSLVLHHFSNEDAVRVLAHAADLSRNFTLVADLRRGLLASFGVAALTAVIFRHPMTRHDARLSAARAFSSHELCRMARQAGWKGFRHAHFRFARQAIWLERTPATGSPSGESLSE
jgi:2-polyprenyl-3-methyl-5-hydroxy-6-metoxy-1,4-benzoquinol methylase